MPRTIALLVTATLLLQACGGGGGSNSTPSPTSPPVPPPAPFESPHPTMWETRSASDAGFNSAALDTALGYAMADGSFTQAALVIRGGKLIEERYRGVAEGEVASLTALSSGATTQDPAFWYDNYGSRDSESPVTSWSTAKSFTSVLIGIAIDKNLITSTDQPASDFITEWRSDARATVTIEQLLDMRSGLVPICFLQNTGALGECVNGSDAAAGGNIVYDQDQMSACINRPLAVDGGAYPWANGGVYTANEFLYSNCDTQVLGEILYRATGQDPGTFAEAELFEPLNIAAVWWRDNVEDGQANGNYLSYCCLDSTARDFAKFGYFMMLGGLELETGTQYASYISSVTSMSSFYDKQFWSFCAETVNEECVNRVIHTTGFDGQFIVIDFKNDLLIVRTSLYKPYLNFSDERKMRLIPGLVAESNWTGSLPSAMAIPINSSFSIREFHAQVVSALTPDESPDDEPPPEPFSGEIGSRP